MLSGFKGKTGEQDRTTPASSDEPVGRTVQPVHSSVEQVAARPEVGPAQVFGRIEGELRASDLLVGEGATVDGSVIAQNVTVCGRVKGTIRAVRVKLQNGG